MSKLKLLIIPSWYPNESDPLWGNYFVKQAEALSNYCDTYMLHINRVGLRELGKFFNNKRYDGYYSDKYSFKFYQKSIINYKSVNLNYSYKKYKKLGYKAYKNFESIIGKPDVILVESVLPAGVLAKYISDKENIPYVVHAHSESVMTNPYYEGYIKEIVKDADSYMAVNSSMKSIVEKYRDKCEIVPNYIDCDRFKPSCEKYKDFTFISISNFYKVKGLDILLKAFSIVVSKGYNVKLKIVGTGEYKSYYQSVSNSLNLKDNVTFVGYVDNKDLPNVLNKCNVLCVSSSFETFCIPIIESLSCGVPVISTDCDGPKEIINKNVGILTPKNDIEKYASKMIYMIENYDKYDSKKIRDYVMSRYDKKVICKKILKICENVKNTNN